MWKLTELHKCRLFFDDFQLRGFLTRRSDLVVNGRYKIGRKLARGAFGQIRLGRHMVTKEGRFPVSGYVTVYCAQR